MSVFGVLIYITSDRKQYFKIKLVLQSKHNHKIMPCLFISEVKTERVQTFALRRGQSPLKINPRVD